VAAGRDSHLAESVEALHDLEGRSNILRADFMGRDGSIQSAEAIARIKGKKFIEYSLSPLFAANAGPEHVALLAPSA
jgi:hypothetical protein